MKIMKKSKSHTSIDPSLLSPTLSMWAQYNQTSSLIIDLIGCRADPRGKLPRTEDTEDDDDPAFPARPVPTLVEKKVGL